jgi:hypothetical protein
MRKYTPYEGDDWLPEDNEEEDGSYSEDYDREFDPDYDNFYR